MTTEPFSNKWTKWEKGCMKTSALKREWGLLNFKSLPTQYSQHNLGKQKGMQISEQLAVLQYFRLSICWELWVESKGFLPNGKGLSPTDGLHPSEKKNLWSQPSMSHIYITPKEYTAWTLGVAIDVKTSGVKENDLHSKILLVGVFKQYLLGIFFNRTARKP